MKNLKTLFTLLFLSISFTSIAQDEELLDVDDAFSPDIIEVGLEKIILRLTIADKYYLYKHAFKFPNDGQVVKFGEAQIPDGHKKSDEFFGEVETYHHKIDITIPYTNPDAKHLTQFKFKYQGCAEAGVCYPPQTKEVDIELPVPEPSKLHNSNPFGGSVSSNLNSDNQWSGQADSVLPESKAFKFETIAMSANKLSTRFTMEDNIYLYKNKVKLTSLTKGIDVKSMKFPKGKIKSDPHFGDVEVYFKQMEIEVQISRENNAPQQLQLQAEFQGCIDEGICYPPSKRIITVNLPQANLLVAEPSNNNQSIELSEQDQIQNFLAKNAWWKTILKFFGFGLLLALTPCIFPMIPILSGLIMGQGEITRSRSFMLSVVYVLAMALAYTAAGVVAGMLGANIQAALQKPWIIITFSFVFVALAMSMFGYYDLQLPASWQSKLSKISNDQKAGSYIGVGIMGFLSAIIVGPCVAPPLAGAVLYISNTGDPIVGGFALFAMSIGMGAPLLLIGASAGKWMPQSGGWMNVVKSFFGIALLAMAIWFLSRILPGKVTLILFGILALLSSIFWYRYAVKNIRKGSKLIGVFLLFKIALIGIGVAEIYGAIKGYTDFMHPLSQKHEFKFITVGNLDELDKKIAVSNKPVLLDFYADWCVECVKMEASTYSDENVKVMMEKFTVLKADVTKQNKDDIALMKKFKIVGPPATLFFTKQGKLLQNSSFFGYKAPQEFVEHLQKIK